MDISIITVNTNDKEHLLPQLASVQLGAAGLSFEQIVSDNGSTDGSVEAVRAKFPTVKIIENKKNLGFGAANNTALPFAQGEFILFLNPDNVVQPNSLEKIVAWMREHENIGIATCLLVDEHGKINPKARPSRFPTVWNQLAIIFKLPHLFPHLLDHYQYRDLDLEKEHDVDTVRGSFMLVRSELIQKLGWAFDPRYYIWFEDVDTCREAKRLGYRVVHTPLIQCTDFVGQTFKRTRLLRKQLWFTTSMVQYFKKWEPWYCWLPLTIARPFGIAFAWVYDTLQKLQRT